MTTQKHIKHISMHVATLAVHWIVRYKQRVNVLLAPKNATCPKPQGSCYASPERAENFPECNCVLNTLSSPNPFCGIYKQEQLAYGTNGCRKYACPPQC